MNPVEKVLRGIDHTQQRTGPLAFAFGVNKKFGDDQAGNLVALLTYYGFLSLFPLLLLLVTVLGLVVGPHSALAHRIVSTATSQFPVIGKQLKFGQMHRNSAFGLVFGLLGLLWGTIGSVQNGQYAMAQVWNIPQVERPGFVPRLLRSLVVLGTMLVFLAVSSGLAGIATFSGHQAVAWRVASIVVSLAVDSAFMLALFRALTPKEVATRDMVPGAIVAGIGWAILQLAGSFLVDHELKNLTSVYGTFAMVLGLLWWIFLIVRMVFYAAEVNVVWARHLWPRSMVQPPLTQADREMLVTYANQERRRPEVAVTAEVEGYTKSAAPETKSAPETEGAARKSAQEVPDSRGAAAR